jgi:hypothetical protein
MTRRHAATRRAAFGPRLHELAERIRGRAPDRHDPLFAPIDLAVMAGSEDPWLRKLAELANREEAR